MKAKRFSQEQIIGVFREAEAGAKTKELCRGHGISEATFYNWKAKFAGMTVRISRKEGQRFTARRSMVSGHGGPLLVRQDVCDFLSVMHSSQ